MLQRKLAKNSKTTFFGEEHLKKQTFNDATQLQVETKINQPRDDPEHDIEVFHDESYLEQVHTTQRSPSDEFFQTIGK